MEFVHTLKNGLTYGLISLGRGGIVPLNSGDGGWQQVKQTNSDSPEMVLNLSMDESI